MFKINPLTKKRLKRFRETRRAWYSFLILTLVFFLSLFAELLCNSRPLAIYFQHKLYVPFCQFYPEKTFLNNGNTAEANYQELDKNQTFRQQGGKILFALNQNDPYRIIPAKELEPYLRIQYILTTKPSIAAITIDKKYTIIQTIGLQTFPEYPQNIKQTTLDNLFTPSPQLKKEIEKRLHTTEALPRYQEHYAGLLGSPDTHIVLSARRKRRSVPHKLRISLREIQNRHSPNRIKGWIYQTSAKKSQSSIQNLPDDARQQLLQALPKITTRAPDLELDLPHKQQLILHKEAVRYPFRPIPKHICGIDDAGRDIFARILYGLRSSLLFGLILVLCSMTIGTLAGMVQGYIGGWVDITAQRLIEIWSALPFLYVIILLGSIYGTSFSLLIFCYALFNWIGISYYMRAEMLRLRKMPFVEAARCLGLPGWKIAIRHILPNSLVPLITFFPFSLVGAIGSLAALDYLGFGLPPPTPSLGQLLQQAQTQRWAYWLILYPSLVLFIVMLLGVFIGEGFRNAYDPKKQNRIH